ncbi:MAG: flagellar export chaperone FliS [Rubrivivax sp.]|jgi:flagellar protein FliS
MYSFQKHTASSYQQVQVETGIAVADPHKLIEMLLEGGLEAINKARGAVERGDQATKSAAIRQAVLIVEEGLRSSLDHTAGGKIAEDLDRLYKYVAWRLTVANLRNDQEILQECFGLLSTVHDSWCAIRGTVGSGRLQ